MIYLPSVPAYSFGKKYKHKDENDIPGPGRYESNQAKNTTLKNSGNVVFCKAPRDKVETDNKWEN